MTAHDRPVLKTRLPKYCSREVTRHGKLVYYVRNSQGQRIRIRGKPWTAPFMKQYLTAIGDAVAMVPPRDLEPVKRRPAGANSFIYFIRSTSTDYIKIGFSANPKQRLAEIATAHPGRVSLLGTMRGTMSDEKALHKRFREHRISGEWFRATKELNDYIIENTRLRTANRLPEPYVDTWADL